MENQNDEQLSRLEDKLEKIQHRLWGNGSLGITTRIDRLEQREVRRDRVIWSVISAAITVVVAFGLKYVGVF